MGALTLWRSGVALRATDAGSGRPVVFQHGLGGSEAQVAEIFPDGSMCCEGSGLRRLTLACRGHDGSALGPEDELSIATFAADVLALADLCGVARFVAGGVSMGAAIALRLAVRQPDRVAGLILVRPAWAFTPAPPNMAFFVEVADLLRAHPPDRGRALFTESATARALEQAAPDNLASLLGFFDRRPVAATVALLSRIAADGPGVSAADMARIAAPTLIVGNDRDAVHPLATARLLSDAIPGAAFVEVTPKATDRARHAADIAAAIAAFCHASEATP